MKGIHEKRLIHATTKKNLLKKFHNKHKNILKELSATEFLHIWNHYDKDGNGYLEGIEIDNFLKELATVSNKINEELDLSGNALTAFKNDFLKQYDLDTNGKLTVDEMAELLPVDENLIFLFQRNNPLHSSAEFLQIWCKFDTNLSGSIEPCELEDFIKFILSKKDDCCINGKKLFEYRYAIMKIFDLNHDGRLQFSELAKLIPIKQNFLSSHLFKQIIKIPRKDMDLLLFRHSDKTTQFYSEPKLIDFLNDLLRHAKISYEQNEFDEFKNLLLALNIDDYNGSNGEKKVSFSVLKMILTCILK